MFFARYKYCYLLTYLLKIFINYWHVINVIEMTQWCNGCASDSRLESCSNHVGSHSTFDALVSKLLICRAHRRNTPNAPAIRLLADLRRVF